MKKKMISSMLAVCTCATMIASVGVSPVSAEDTTEYKTLFKEDFDGSNYKDGVPPLENLDFTGGRRWNASASNPGARVKQDLTQYYYTYNSAQPGDLNGYSTMFHINYINTSQWGPTNRCIWYFPDKTQNVWYMDVKLGNDNDEYKSMPVGALAQKALDASLIMSYRTGEANQTAKEPMQVQLKFTSGGEEHTYKLGEMVINTVTNNLMNNGLHVRKSLAKILELDGVNAWDEATDIRIRFTGDYSEEVQAKLIEIMFDNILIKEADPKELFSEDFEERAWVGSVYGSVTKASLVDTIDGIDMTGRGEVFKLLSTYAEFGHECLFRMPNADPTKCYKIAFDAYYPTSNVTNSQAEVWVREEKGAGDITNLSKVLTFEKNDGFTRYEGTFDFSREPEVMADRNKLGLFIKFGDRYGNGNGDVMYLDNITVTEIPVRKIDFAQKDLKNWFTDTNTLANGALTVSFRNTEEDCTGLVAKYAEDGKLLGVEELTVGTDKTYETTVTVDDNVKKVAGFMWDKDTIKPLSDSKSVTKPVTE